MRLLSSTGWSGFMRICDEEEATKDSDRPLLKYETHLFSP
jgi:hypothetical protein